MIELSTGGEGLAAAKRLVVHAESIRPGWRSRPDLARAYARALAVVSRAGFSTKLWCLWRRPIGAGRVFVPPRRATA